MTRPTLRFVPAVAALAAWFLAPAAAQAQAQVTVNGSVVDIEPPPIIQAGRVFVPLRGVFEQLGASVVYADGTINATGNGREISLQIGSTQATVNGQPQTIDVAPFIVGESTFVPLRFISEALGDSVNWDETDEIAAIDTGGGSATYYTPGTASYVDTAPPPIPDYDQPDVPQQNDIWQPGYWAWGLFGYYWVPGTWVQAPQSGYLWTPGYWQWNNYGYNWNPGYWAVAVGFYGGVNYGGGYFGRGYDGGRWSHDRFSYNSYVSRVNVTNITNVYVDRNIYVNSVRTRASYNGGHGGMQVRPTAQEASIAHDRHLGMTEVQREHVQAAEQDRRLLATATHDKPAVLAVARPLSRSNPPAGFVAVKPSDRVNPLANVAPARVAPRRSAPRAPAVRAPVVNAPTAHAPVAHVPAGVPGVHTPAGAAAPGARAPIAHAPVAHAPVAHGAAAPPVAHAPAPNAHAPAPIAHAPAARAPVEPEPVARAAVVHAPAERSIVPPAHVSRPAAFIPPPARAPSVHAAPLQTLREIPAAPRVRAPVVNAAPPVRAAPVRAAPAPRAAPPAPRAAPPGRSAGGREQKPRG